MIAEELPVTAYQPVVMAKHDYRRHTPWYTQTP